MKRGKGMKFVGDSRVKADGRMKNIPKDYSEYPGKTEAFWPNYLLKEWMVGAVFLMGFLCLTIAHPAPLERMADPAAAGGYIPLPDWYFLFLYQLLKYEYASDVVGTVIIPGLAFGALLLAPWLDTGKERRPLKRPVASSLMMLGVISVIFLTWESVDQHDWEAAAQQGEIVEEGDINTEAEGYEIYVSNQSCIGCHGDTMAGGAGGPTLLDTEKTPEEVINIIQNGSENGAMPGGLFEGTDEELEILAEYIAAHGQPEDE
ncbi:cytochrome CBB3 [Alkalihalobacillus alcalophilus ATCC 27647 = CGMCC 1.3604]|uniref:Cytochrome CBB3 n=1 Tax=Alkalihalobacillus alcalophilus ATCC 27647 = CGMCC 1.3604 TaxID=1218173 RepID=A0A094XK30_ALKAL|nr:menaquinol-cytochrome c reductase cytochrome b/c subunit [Alkalihalobacillus alcalophilus]KGA99125.1 cytochrome Cbb3 [Alkalihalobacillus alcalophilus ATCC 27647 = CGMCC 1.3604]MED1560472.1 c-type cytochrome [Alkalihalobacillus alcalophilus]THG92010.1 cytochrome CBB3 [Alkalihalobacillus alcalophilus ATCC 27647 = CGMCC 1.3604]